MKDKDYTWKAIYTDKSTFSQFNDDDTENLFADIELDKLDVFVISSPSDPNAYQVNVPQGVISVNGQLIRFGAHDSNRLIYFRRKQQVLGQHFSAPGFTLHCFGLQATVDGENKKLIFGVDQASDEVFYLEE